MSVYRVEEEEDGGVREEKSWGRGDRGCRAGGGWLELGWERVEEDTEEMQREEEPASE